MNERGAVRNRNYATQVRDYRGLCYGKITPTDIDGLIEYHNKAYVIIELKHAGAELPYGQRLAIERLCDDLSDKKPTIGVIASHDCDGDIDAANATVTEMRFRGKWKRRHDETTRQLIDKFLSWVDFEYSASQD